MNRIEIGETLKRIREEKELTWYAVAKAAKINIGQLKSVESGSSAYTVDVLIKVCESLDLSIELRPAEICQITTNEKPAKD